MSTKKEKINGKECLIDDVVLMITPIAVQGLEMHHDMAPVDDNISLCKMATINNFIWQSNSWIHYF